QAALDARTEQGELETALRGGEDLEAHERELDLLRQNHERRQALVAKERAALEELATATDAFADLRAADGGDAGAKLSATQQQLHGLARELRAADAARRQAADGLRVASEALTRAGRAAEIEGELGKLAGAESRLEESAARLRELRDRRAEANVELVHQERHRQSLVEEGGESGVCPTCHRELEGTVDELLAELDAAIAAARERREVLDRELGELEEAERETRLEAQREVQLRAELEALGEPGEEAALAAEMARAEALLEKAQRTEAELEQRHDALEAEIPQLRAAAEEFELATAERRKAQDWMLRAEQQVTFLAEQLTDTPDDGYDAEAHSKVKTALEIRAEALRRLAVARERAASAELLEKQFRSLSEEAEQVVATVMKLREAAEQVAPEPGAQEKLSAERDQLAAKLEGAREELEEANRRAATESEAVAAARSRLADAKGLAKRIDAERREFELRTAVAGALEEYREEASRRARPMLESEASKFLRQTTEAAYPRVRLTEDYFLEIAEGRDFFSSKRFSGGEQDLAALCLRLALARTLAHQRGTEHSFVILDEVFGSQDVGRRQLLIEQLIELSKREFEQIFVISHTEDIVDQCSLHITVRRENGISEASGPTGQ
ncbi:MAG TPA: SbcC/MukB-like Walker B domain-containing protein, partial [Solirubrobacterales bacterium]|nr:SbcC/MukB-like Walker B domain-containing protein [Solirubrobacterales bacterium]